MGTRPAKLSVHLQHSALEGQSSGHFRRYHRLLNHAKPLTCSFPRIKETEQGVGNFILALRNASFAVKKSLA